MAVDAITDIAIKSSTDMALTQQNIWVPVFHNALVN